MATFWWSTNAIEKRLRRERIGIEKHKISISYHYLRRRLRHFPFSLFLDRDVPCVTYESVDRAFLAAQQKMNFPRPKGRSMTDIDVDHLGQILVETSRNLALE